VVRTGLWIAACALSVVSVLALRMRFRRYRPTERAPLGFAVRIFASGRSGRVEYEEDRRSAHFDWEFAAGGDVAHLMVPTRAEWAERTPWSTGRREEILTRVAQEVVRQKCPGCTWTIDDDSIRIHESKARPIR